MWWLPLWMGLADPTPVSKPIDPEADLDPGAVANANTEEARVAPEPESGYPPAVSRRPVTLPSGIEAGVDLGLVRLDDGRGEFAEVESRTFVSSVARLKVGIDRLELEGGLEVSVAEIDGLEGSRHPIGVRAGYGAIRYAPTEGVAGGVDLTILHNPRESVQLYLPRLLGTVKARSDTIGFQGTGFIGAGFAGEDFDISETTDTVLVVGADVRVPFGNRFFTFEPRVGAAFAPREAEVFIGFGAAAIITPSKAFELATSIERREEATLMLFTVTGRYFTESLGRF